MTDLPRWTDHIADRQINIVGRRNHGKTLLVTDLVIWLTDRGIRVGTLKHSSHVHILEPPGKDTSRHREAGALPTAIVMPDSTAVFLSIEGDDAPDVLAPLYRNCDVVIVEGLATSAHPHKIEVWRSGGHTPPLATEISGIRAVITEPAAAPDLGIPIWDRADIDTIARSALAMIDRLDLIGE